MRSPNGSSLFMQVVSDAVARPRTDDRTYRVIKLENGLEALLISDETTDKASAALDVNVGAYSDPENLPGLAHFLEHLLFMGTEKFPNESEYSKYLTDHAGSYNAYTSSENTNYYFDVSWQHLEGALDRFSQFFIAPLFSENCKDREILAVDSENKKNLSNDWWRFSQVEKSLCNPEHPYHKFSTGNYETLGKTPISKGIDVREELVNFYKTHYTSSLMKLVILGREDIDTLQNLVIEYFSPVPNAQNEKDTWSVPPVTEQHLGTLTKVRPIMDLKQLEIRFLVPEGEQFYKKNPSNYFSHLIGHESKGSLLYYFKQKSWANGLSCGVYPISDGYEFFIIEIELTKDGLENWQEIVKSTFQYINMLKEVGPKPWIFDELKRASLASFWYMQKSKPSTTASRYARIMHRKIPREDILSHSIPTEYDPKLLADYIKYLKPANSRFTLISQSFQDLDKTEKWYGTQYSSTDESQFIKELDGVGTSPKNFHIPVENQFVPNDFEVLGTTTAVYRPTLIVRKPGYRVWYKKDDVFDVPKAQVYFKLTGSVFDSDPTAHMATEVLVQLINDALNDYTYYAEVAGLNYSLTSSQNGIEVHISGFNEKLSNLLGVIIDTLRDTEFSAERFSTIRERIRRNISNARYDNPYKQLSTQTSLSWLVAGMWPWDVRLDALKTLELKDITNHRQAVLKELDMEFLVVGNFTANDAKSLCQVVKDGIPSQPLHTKPFKPSYWLPRSSHFAYVDDLMDKEEPNSAIACRFQLSEGNNYKERAALELVCQIIKVPVFDTLRTKEQLGYVVGSYSRNIRNSMYLDIIAQSEKPTDYLEERIEALLPFLRNVIENMSESEFQSNVAAVVENNREKHKSLRQEASSYWSSILSGYYDFSRREKVAKEASTTIKSDVLSLFDKYIINTGRAKFVVHLRSAKSTSTPKGEILTNLDDFHAKLKYIDLPKPVSDLESYEKDEPKL